MNAPADLAGPAPADLYRELAKTGLPRRLFELARDEDLAAAGDIPSDRIAGERIFMRKALEYWLSHAKPERVKRL